MADMDSARNRITSIPEQVRVEEQRNGAVNGVIIDSSEQITSYQWSISLAKASRRSASLQRYELKSVCTRPGAIAFTRTPCGPNSLAQHRVIMFSPALLNNLYVTQLDRRFGVGT